MSVASIMHQPKDKKEKLHELRDEKREIKDRNKRTNRIENIIVDTSKRFIHLLK